MVLRLQVVSNPVEPGVPLEERQGDHLRLVEAYIRSRRLRNLNTVTNERVRRVLDAFFVTVGKQAWDVSEEDVALWHEGLIQAGLSVATRRGYVGFVRTFYDYVRDHPCVPLTTEELKQGRTPVSVQVKYGRELIQPVGFWVSVAHAAENASTDRYLPTREELRAFFAWLRRQMETARKPLPLARDYALYRFLYHTGLRANELVNLTLRDLRMETLVIHVRVGKGTNGSGPRSRWVPMVYGIERVLQVYLKEVRSLLTSETDPKSPVFVTEQGEAIQYKTVHNKLNILLEQAQTQGVPVQRFGVHDFRRAFATHFYEEYPTKVELLREILGHSSVSTTMHYTRPSRKYYEQQFAAVLGQRFGGFPGEGEP